MDASSSPWNPAPAPVSSPSLLLPIPAIVFIAVGIYLLLLGLVLLTRHCLLVRGLVGAEEWALGKRNLVNLCPHLHALTLRLLAIYLVPTSVPSMRPKKSLLCCYLLNLLLPLSPKPCLGCLYLPPGPDSEPCHLLGPGLLYWLQLPLQEARRLQAPRLLLDLCRSLQLPSA